MTSADYKPNDMYNSYLEAEVLTADPVKLVKMLYHGALDATTSARAHLLAGDIRARSKSVTKAHSILIELSNSLDLSQGEAIGANLARLYEYMQIRLLDANREQRDEPLAEVERLLKTLLEAWENCASERAEFQSPAAHGYEVDFESSRQTVCCSY